MKNSDKMQWVTISVLVIVIIFLFNKIDTLENKEIIRAKGIIISDEEGIERILIGAPIPKSIDRIRDDYKKVENTYAKDFPPETNFMDLYKTKIRSSMNGILFLDKFGYDKLALGDPVPDPYYGTKIGLQSGLIVTDSLGAERTGYGVIKIGNRYRVVLGLDREDGIEGISMGVDDKYDSKLTLRSKDLNEIIEIGESKGPNNTFGYTYSNKKDNVKISKKFEDK